MSNVMAGDALREFLLGYHGEEGLAETLAEDYVLVKLPVFLTQVEWSRLEDDEDEIMIGGRYRPNWNKYRVQSNIDEYAKKLESLAEDYRLALKVKELVETRAKELRESYVLTRRKELVAEYGYPSFVEAPKAVQDLINKLAVSEYLGSIKDKDLW